MTISGVEFGVQALGCCNCLPKSYRQVTIFQESARNHFREAGIVMQSYMVETVHQPFRNNSFLVCTPGNDFYVNYNGQRSSSAFFNF